MGGVKGLQAHKFFKGLDWVKVEAKETKAYFVPKVKHSGDSSNFAGRYKQTEAMFNSKFK
jgi:hypothetical protein